MDLERYRSYLRLLAARHADPRLGAKVDVSDLVQQTLMKAFQARDEFRGATSAELAGWLRKILARTILDAARHLRRRKRDAALDRSLDQALAESSVRLGQWLAAPGDSPGTEVAREERILRLCDALSQLPEPQREALLLKHGEGLSVAEVGRRLGRSPAAVASLLRRGLHRFRETMGEEESS